jgi:hypothetical protein
MIFFFFLLTKTQLTQAMFSIILPLSGLEGCIPFSLFLCLQLPTVELTDNPSAMIFISDGLGVGVRVQVGTRFFPSPFRAGRFLGPPNLLLSRYRGLLPQEQSNRGVKLTSYLQLMPRLRICGYINPLPPRFHCLRLAT